MSELFNLFEMYNQTAAARVGHKIKKIRTEKGLSQEDLGKKVGLSADRIQKYENGARRPKSDMLSKIANALNVSPLALVDPDTSSYIGAMYALFDLEANFNVAVDKEESDYGNGLSIKISYGNEFSKYVDQWYKAKLKTNAMLLGASSEEEKEEIIKAYHEWEWNYPCKEFDGNYKEIQKSKIKNYILDLIDCYKDLNDTPNENDELSTLLMKILMDIRKSEDNDT